MKLQSKANPVPNLKAAEVVSRVGGTSLQRHSCPYLPALHTAYTIIGPQWVKQPEGGERVQAGRRPILAPIRTQNRRRRGRASLAPAGSSHFHSLQSSVRSHSLSPSLPALMHPLPSFPTLHSQNHSACPFPASFPPTTKRNPLLHHQSLC